ncbi:Condensin complex subunit 3 [Linum perenne]
MGAMETNEEEGLQLCRKIAKILDETKTSNATHIRKLKDLSSVLSKSPSPSQFTAAFCKALTPLFCIQRRTSSAERVVRFVSTFAGAHASGRDTGCDEFLEELLRFLLVASAAVSKTSRFRACQMISEIIMRLPDDAEVSDDVWDDVIECMMLRARDKASVIRTFAVRALSRFVNDAENSDILNLLLEVLELEQSAEVRKTVLLALPPTNATSLVIVDCTLDVSESVRKAAYCVLANKFPLQSLSIKLRTLILQRGLADRSIIVSKECLKLLRDEWLSKCCNNDPIELLKYLDVETYELVGEAVMDALLKEGSIILDNQSIQEYITSTASENEGFPADSPPNIELMEPEAALYWKTVCRFLQTKAQAKGSDAAVTTGTEAAVYAAEASDSNDLLDRILPATVFDYVALVKAHIDAGANYRFASRQLLLLGAMVDFSDTTCRKIASAFLQNLLHSPLDFETDETGNEVVIGDGLNLGGDKDWADAVTSLAKKVHSGIGEIESAFLVVVEELIRPCRERTADFKQWMHCLAVTGLLLQNAKSFHLLQGQAIQPSELLQSLLLPAAKHVHLDVQRVSIRCLGLFGLLEKKPSEDVAKQLRLSFVRGPAPISAMACKALMDLALWHGPRNVDNALRSGDVSQSEEIKMAFNTVNFLDADDNTDVEFLDLLYAGLDRNDWGEAVESDESEILQAVLGEGLAKILLLSENYTSIPSSLHPLLLGKLIELYFSDETNDLQRLKQCLSVFFEHYPTISANHKKYLSKAFVPVMHSMWPGIFGNGGGSSVVVSNLRKRAIQASRFMLQMMQVPLYVIHNETENTDNGTGSVEDANHSSEPALECSEEGLAVRIATELASFTGKRTPAERSYISALCRILVLIQFRVSEQDTIKLMRRLLNQLTEYVPLEKDVMKELKLMAERLSSLDSQPEEELPQDQANLIFGKLEVEFNLDVEVRAANQQTPGRPRASRQTRPRRRAKDDEEISSEEETLSVPVPVAVAGSSRSQRASKTAALSKLQGVAGRKRAATTARIEEDEEEEEEDESEVTSEDNDDSDDDLF